MRTQTHRDTPTRNVPVYISVFVSRVCVSLSVSVPVSVCEAASATVYLCVCVRMCLYLFVYRSIVVLSVCLSETFGELNSCELGVFRFQCCLLLLLRLLQTNTLKLKKNNPRVCNCLCVPSYISVCQGHYVCMYVVHVIK